MLDHVIVTVSDFTRSIAFYEQALKPLGITDFLAYEGQDYAHVMVTLCLSQIKSGRICDAVIRRGLGGKEYAPPSQQYAIGANPYPGTGACSNTWRRWRSPNTTI